MSERSSIEAKQCFWTEFEEEHLKKLLKKTSISRAASMLGRPLWSVEDKLVELRKKPRWKPESFKALALMRGMGLSYAEIGDALNLPPDTCRKAFSRNLEKAADVWRQLILEDVDLALRSIGCSDADIDTVRAMLAGVVVPRFDEVMSISTSEDSSSLRTFLSVRIGPHTDPKYRLRTYTLSVPFCIYRLTLY